MHTIYSTRLQNLKITPIFCLVNSNDVVIRHRELWFKAEHINSFWRFVTLHSLVNKITQTAVIIVLFDYNMVFQFTNCLYNNELWFLFVLLVNKCILNKNIVINYMYNFILKIPKINSKAVTTKCKFVANSLVCWFS